MHERRRGSGYHEAAQRVTGDGDEHEPPRRSAFACSAHGCPLWGSITLEGARQCFVHSRIPDRQHWDSVTVLLQQRPRVIETIRILRRGEHRESAALLEAFGVEPRLRERWATLGDVPSRYAALSELERLLIADCTDHVEASMHESGARADAMRQVDEIASRIASRLAPPAVDKPAETQGAPVDKAADPQGAVTEREPVTETVTERQLDTPGESPVEREPGDDDDG